MAPKTAAAQTTTTGTAVAAQDPNQVPAYLNEVAKEDAGKGVSTDSKDNIVPLIYVLHFSSPQVDEASSQRIPNARPGDLWLRNAPQPVISGDQGILVQPIRFWKDWGEWVPRERGGGMMGRHPNRIATAEDVKRLGAKLVEGEDMPDCAGATFAINPKNKQKVWTVPRDGAANDLVHTRNHAVRVFVDDHTALPFVIPMKSTGHSVSKTWMGKMMGKLAQGGDILPSFACLYRLTTRQRSNVQGKWFQIEVNDAGYVSADEYRNGKSLFMAFESGEKVAEAEAEASDADGEATGSSDEKLPF